MARPRQIYIRVPDTSYSLEVDLTKYDCLREEPHCHVCNSSGSRVAQVWLRSCTFAKTPAGIPRDEQNYILSAVARNRNSLESIFMYNKEHGND